MSAIGSQACPYLGRCEDAANYYFFPTADNCCHSESRPFAVEPAYQAQVCLPGGWATCTRYKIATGAAVDEEQADVSPPAPVKHGLTPRVLMMIVGAAVVLLGALFLALRPWSNPPQAQYATSTPTTTRTTATSALGLTPRPSPILVAGGTGEPTPTVVEPSPSSTPTPSATWTPTSTPSPTATRRATATATRTRMPTSSPTWTQTPTRTPTPTASPTLRPTTTSTPLPAPVLVAPPDGHAYSRNAQVVLAWEFSAELPADAYYVLSVAYTHAGETWHDDVPWTRAMSWTLSEHRYLLDLCDDGWYWWSVQVYRRTGVNADGKPVGVPMSPASQVWAVRWGGIEGGPEPGKTPPAQATPEPPEP